MAKERGKKGAESGKGADSGKKPAAPVAEDLVSIHEKGNFASARCDCGWRGPARRARKRARQDAAEHWEQGCEVHRPGKHR